MTAEDCLLKRFTALAGGDYATVYATYHQDSPFLQHFADCAAYVAFAQDQLSSIEVMDWRSLRQRQIDADQQEHLLVIELSVDNSRQYFYELALLIHSPDGWRYHSAQKLGAEDYSGPPAQIQFDHFDRVAQKIRY